MKLLFTALFCLAAAMPSSDSAASFAGTWEAKLAGKVFARFVIKPGTPVSGELSLGAIRADESGTLIEVDAEPVEGYPMLNPQIKANLLAFSWDDGDGQGKLELRLAGTNRAELRFVTAPFAVKPIKLTRTR